MRIDVWLTENGFSSSRTKAKEMIEAGRVLFDGKNVQKPSFEVENGEKILVKPSENEEYVGRGGIKIAFALDSFGVSPMGKVCADIGASTGGFTHCLLKRGAERVYAIDSGSLQLAEVLKNDERVVSMEKTNARYLKKDMFDVPPSLVVMDVSFISQKLLYEAIRDVSESKADIITLIKPQFEAGRNNLDKHGVVKEEKVRKAVVEDIKSYGEMYGFKCMGVVKSPITGGSGNVEYLIHFSKNEDF